MKDLLKRFVELAPKSWPISAEALDDGFLGTLSFDITDDRESAEAIIFLWDWLEGESVAGALGAVDIVVARDRGRNGQYVCEQWLVPNADAPVVTHSGVGTTRIEALVRACVAVLEAKGRE